jgi:hypothetical protein
MALTTVRDDSLTPSTDLAQAGAVFSDSTRLLEGGQGGGKGGTGQGKGGQGAQGGGPIASGGDGNSSEHGNHGGHQPVPTFWNLTENEQGKNRLADRGHHHFELMWHHA